MCLHFKKCTLLKLNQLVEISRQTFVDAFEKDNDPEDFKAYVDSAFHREFIRTQLKNPNTSFYFAYKDDFPVGYFKLNIKDAQTDIKSEEAIELERIYVAKKYQGKQIGARMLHEAIKLGSELNKTYIWLGVWQKNEGAVRFYEKHGFVKFGTHPYYIGEDKQTDWLMRYDLINFRED